MRKLTLIIFLLLLCGVTSASDEVEKTVKSYFAAFNESKSAEDLVGEYWNPVAMIVMPNEVLKFDSHQDSERWMAAMQSEIGKAGWLRSEFMETSTCQLSNSVALFSFRFKRVFENGSEVASGGTYTLIKSDRWRIMTLIVAEPKELVSCGPSDA
jgi:hypothetical protein